MIYYTLITFDTLEYSISDPYAQVLVEQEILPFTEVIVWHSFYLYDFWVLFAWTQATHSFWGWCQYYHYILIQICNGSRIFYRITMNVIV